MFFLFIQYFITKILKIKNYPMVLWLFFWIHVEFKYINFLEVSPVNKKSAAVSWYIPGKGTIATKNVEV